MKKTLFLLFLSALMFLISSAQTPVPGGLVSGTWTKAASPYHIEGSVMIAEGTTLSIEPGVVVNFHGTFKLMVQGRLLAVGTETDSITFTSFDTISGWHSIRFDNTPVTNDTSRLSYCKIQYGRAHVAPPDDCGGGLFFRNFSKAVVSHCLISDCSANSAGGGISLEGSSPFILNNIISNNSASNVGGGIQCFLNSHPLISGNIISHNSTEGNGGGGISIESANPTIAHNIINYNSSPVFSGGGIWCNSGIPVIISNFICNNSAGSGGAIQLLNCQSFDVVNNLMANNYADDGGGVAVINSSGISFTNNHIVNNHAIKGGGVFCAMVSSPGFRNTIFWGNTDGSSRRQIYILDEGSDPDFYYCDVEGGWGAFDMNNTVYTGEYLHNIDANPMFIHPPSGSGIGYNGVTADWTMQYSSFCINGGDPAGTYPQTDLADNPRIFGSCIDIGAYEFQGQDGLGPMNGLTQLKLFPNPVSDYLIIDNQRESDIEIITTEGQLIKTINNAGPAGSMYIGDLPSGVYLAKIKTGSGMTITKFVKR